MIPHPSYLGPRVNSLGWALVLRSGVGVLLTLLTIPPVLARIRAEETLLRTQFDGEYDAYCGRTWRLIPPIYENAPHPRATLSGSKASHLLSPELSLPRARAAVEKLLTAVAVARSSVVGDVPDPAGTACEKPKAGERGQGRAANGCAESTNRP